MGLALIGVALLLVRARPIVKPVDPTSFEVPTIDNTTGLDPLLIDSIERGVAAVRERPSASTFGSLGRLYDSHNYRKLAKVCYETAASLDPNNSEWPYHLGVLADVEGDTEAARASFERTLHLEPDYLPARLQIAEGLITTNRLEDAAAILRSAASSHPGSPWIPLQLARIALRTGEPKKAIEHLERVFELAPDDSEAHYLLAQAYRMSGHQDLAKQALSGIDGSRNASRFDDRYGALVQRQRRDLGMLIRSANRLYKQGRKREAEAQYREVLKWNPEHYTALFNLGVLRYETGRQRAAVQVLERAVAVRERGMQAHFALAAAYLRLGQSDRARTELARTLELDPQHAEARHLLGQLGPPPNR